MKVMAAKLILIMIVALGACIGTGRGNEAQAANPLQIRLGTLALNGSSFHKVLGEMGEKWRKSTGGAVDLTIYAGTMGGEAKMVQKMVSGNINAALLTVVGLSEIDEAVGGLSYLPMMYRSWEEFDYVRAKMAPKLEKLLQDKGYAVMFWGDAGWVYYFSKIPVVRPDDFKKLKLWTWAGDTTQSDLMRRLGYQPVPLETTEILPQLQTGMINAFAQPAYFAMISQCYRQARNMLHMKWTVLAGAMVIRKSVWDTIAPETQKSMREAAAVAGEDLRANSRKEDVASIAAMREKGLTVHEVSSKDEEEWRQLAQRIYGELRGTRMVRADIFDEVQRLVNEYRAASKGTGK
jgi:TRAP-type C4-dicarboxylate transport system substrate-binding protein